MAKETIGYVKLEWTCPFCGAKNPGTNKKCSNCGSPQPEDVQFEQALQEKLVEDETLIEKAKAGPDIHCPFCGTRNPAGTETCSNCMGDLSDATTRVKGKVVGKHRTEAVPDIACPFCQTMNPATAHQCTNCGGNLNDEVKPKAVAQPVSQRRGLGVVGIIGIVAVIALCIFVASLFLRTDDVIGQVSSVEWTRQVAIESLVPVEHGGFVDEIPSDAAIGACRLELHHVQDNPAPNAERICGTPYTVDTGTGVGEVVQDCQYQVYEEYCDFTVEEWRQVDVATLNGNNLNPLWPEPQLEFGERLGAEAEQFEIIFDSDGDRFTYTTERIDDFIRFEVGSEWVLQVNQLGSVVSIEPAQ
jgi:ribosomal protein L40E